MADVVASIVGGRPVSGAPGGTRVVPNPARLDEVVAEAALRSRDVRAGVRHREGGAGRMGRRAGAGARAGDPAARPTAESNLEALARLITREIGKPIAESRGEVQEVVDTCNFFVSEGRRLYGMTVPSELPDKQLFTFRVPVGVAAIVTAGNFPVAVPWYLVPALLCGNAVMWKPAEYTPSIAEAFARLFLHAGFPAGVFSMVLADGPVTFEGLERSLDEGLVDKVGFTGSTDVGRRSANSAGGTCSRRASSSAARTRSS